MKMGELWAILDSAIADLSATLHRYNVAMTDAAMIKMANEPVMGPAEDGQRLGLPIQLVGSVAVIPVMGPIMRRAGMIARWRGIVGAEDVRAAVRLADADPAVSHIVLAIDSPGGSVSGIEEAARVVRATQKPVTAQVQGMACSAAYYIAAAADRIVAGPADVVGSIGVRAVYIDDSKYYEEMGVRFVPIDTGEFKSMGLMGQPFTDRHKAEAQRMVDAFMDQFIDAVATGRGMSEQRARELGDGRVWASGEALQLGLIDAVATIEETMADIAGDETQRPPGRSTQAARKRLAL